MDDFGERILAVNSVGILLKTYSINQVRNMTEI